MDSWYLGYIARLQFYTKMEHVGLLIAVLGNITPLLHNIISQM